MFITLNVNAKPLSETGPRAEGAVGSILERKTIS